MIDMQKFRVGMATLAGCFGREIDAPVLKAYYAVLSPKLTTEQFAASCFQAMQSERFWPSPAVLLEKVLGGAEDRSAKAWETIYRLAAGDKFRQVTTRDWEGFDGPTRAAISAIGGLHVFGNVSDFELATLQRTFRRAYRDAAQAKPALAAGRAAPDDRRLAAGGSGAHATPPALPGLPPLVHEGPVRTVPPTSGRGAR